MAIYNESNQHSDGRDSEVSIKSKTNKKSELRANELQALKNVIDFYNLNGYEIREDQGLKNRYFLLDNSGTCVTGSWDYIRLNHFIMGYGKATNKLLNESTEYVRGQLTLTRDELGFEKRENSKLVASNKELMWCLDEMRMMPNPKLSGTEHFNLINKLAEAKTNAKKLMFNDRRI